jgi:predicted acetyltransferase
MMRAQLDACRERGEPLAYLWATEDRIYDRFGYGIAAFSAEIDVPRHGARLHQLAPPAADATLMPLSEAESVIAPIYQRVARTTPGMFTRSSAWWQARTLADSPWRRGNSGELQCVIIAGDIAPAAYALYRITPSFERGVQTGAVHVVEALGTSAAATRAVWHYLLEIDWMARTTAALLPVDHPLLLLAAEPRRLRFSLRDGVWVRLIDLEAALSARRFEPAASVVLDVTDAFCPWNSGRWRVGADGVARTAAAAELRCDIGALSSVYLGGFTWTQLSRALRAVELAPGAAARADAAFRTPCAPWCPEIF